MKIIDYLLLNSKKFPNKVAFTCGNTNLTYKELENQVAKLSAGFVKNGIKKNDHIMLILNNSIEFILSLYAGANLGLVVIPINTSLNRENIIKQIKLTKTKYIIGWHGILDEILIDKKKFPIKQRNCISVGNNIKGCENFLNLINQKYEKKIFKKNSYNNNIDFIYGLTSGSTSEPKAVVFTQKTKILRSLHAKKIYRLNRNEKIIISTPIYHSISLRLVILPVILGASCVIMEKFNKKYFIELVKKYKITFSIMVASQIELISNNLNQNNILKLVTLKKIVSCCSHLKKEVKFKIIKKLKNNFYDTYGASEVGTLTNFNFSNNIKKINSLGKIVPNVKIKIVDEKGKKQKNGNIGNILCNSTMKFSGYYNNKKLTKKSIQNGYFSTGDIGYIDNKSFLYLTGRKKDVIITGGINVFAMDIEKIINLHPKIKESAVIGLKDKRLGEAIMAIVIPKKINTLEVNELKKYCAKNLADYQQPLGFDIVNDMPRGSLNKISKFKLKSLYSNYDLSITIRKVLKN